MKIFNAIYVHGKLYDIESEKRIILDENAKLNVIVEEKYILEKDPYNSPGESQSEEDLIASINKKKYADYKKLASVGEKLNFIIKAGKKGKHKSAIECTFTVILNQSLFLLKKHKNSQYGVVYPCSCVVEEEKTKFLKHFEPVFAYSLNDAYMKTYDTYFALYGKPTTNIYNNFQLINKDKPILLSQLRMWPVVKI